MSRERRQDLPKIQRNPDPALHPFESSREYMRALNAVKLRRLFAKPFIGQLGSGHKDGVYCLGKHFSHVESLVSGAADGELCLWDASAHSKGGAVSTPIWRNQQAHNGFIRGVAFIQNEKSADKILSCGDDGTVKLWNTNQNDSKKIPLSHWTSPDGSPLTALDTHPSSSQFSTSGQIVSLWHTGRPSPIQNYEWGHDTFTTVRFNPVEGQLIASAATDRSLILFDTRMQTPLHRLVLSMRTNAIAWHPREPFNLATGSDDHQAYLWDMRNMKKGSLNIFKGHAGPILDLDFSPTGQTLVTASYDKTIRLFDLSDSHQGASSFSTGHSRDVYHTKRMQKVFSVKVSMDSQTIFTGSDDGQVRCWRMNASSKPSYQNYRQQTNILYHDALVKKYSKLPEISIINQQRHLPKVIVAKRKEERLMKDSKKRKLNNRRIHSKPGAVPFVSERTTQVVTEKK